MANVKGAGDGPSTASSGWSNNANTGNVTSALNTMQAGNYNTSDTQEWNEVTGGMSVAQFQQLPQAEQLKLTTQIQNITDARAYAPSLFDQIMGGIALTASVGAATAGFGATLAPAIGAAGSVVSGTAGTIANGALTGAAGGVLRSTLTGQNIGTGALTGAVGGGLGAAAAPLASGLSSSTGLSAPVSGALVKGASGIGESALGSALSGSNTSGSAMSVGADPFTQLQTTPNSSGTVIGSGTQSTNPSAPNYVGALPGGGTSYAPASSGAGNILGALGAGAGTSAMSGQGNNGNMAGTDTSLASTITGALPGVLQAGSTTAGALAGSNAITGAENNVITTNQNNLGNINNIWSTQQQLGQGADTSLGSALGTNGQPANYSNFENMPGYQFAVSQGTQAIQRQAASMGNAYTPNTAAAVGQYVTGTASQDYNTYISQLMGAAGLGSTANTQLQTANQNTTNNIGTAQQNIGEAQAGAYNTAGNAAAGLFSPNGSGTGLINGLTGGSGGGFNSSGVPQGNGTSASNSSDPFAGTSLANNQNAINAYDQSNGPTAGDISYDTSGATTGSNSLSNLDTGTLAGDAPTSGWLSDSDFDVGSAGSDATSFLGDW